MKVFVLGGTGFIGRQVVNGLVAKGHEAVVLSRSAEKGKKILGDKVEVVEGNAMSAGTWQDKISECQAVIVLVGEPIVDKKWTEQRKQLLVDSRVVPTKLVIEAMSKAAEKPEVLICGSAIGYYGNHAEEFLTEESEAGTGFSAQLCKVWEAEANKAYEYGVRVVNLRTGFVLGEGGALKKMLPPFRFFMGGPMGSGNQYMSWIHISDYSSIVSLVLTNNGINGPVNMTAPNSVTNREFSKAVGQVLRRPSWLRVPEFALKLMFGESASLMLEGQRVNPKKALDNGYKFKFETIEEALTDLLR